MQTRRTVLTALGALAFLNMQVLAGTAAGRYLTCARKADGTYVAVVFDQSGKTLSILPLSERGHGAAIAPDGRQAVVFGRRPADFMLVFAMDAPDDARQLTAMDGRHFYGHGCFSADGKVLFTTENAYDEGRGVIGVHDATDGFKRIGEFSSGGVGPHEVILLSDGETLAVANGGIETHPDYPRQKLNIPTMAPNLSYLDTATGSLLDKAEPPADLHQLSLRHLSEAGDGTIWIGGQYEGPANRQVPLIAVHRPGEALYFIRDEAPTAALRQYVGSVARSADGSHIGITSPRGGVLQIWRVGDRSLAAQHAMADVCGLAIGQDGFIASDGTGRLWTNQTPMTEMAGWAWDNHIVATSGRSL